MATTMKGIWTWTWTCVSWSPVWHKGVWPKPVQSHHFQYQYFRISLRQMTGQLCTIDLTQPCSVIHRHNSSTQAKWDFMGTKRQKWICHLSKASSISSNHFLHTQNAPLHHVPATPAGVLLHLHLAVTEHLRQLGEEPLVPLDGALKLPEKERCSAQHFCWSSVFLVILTCHSTIISEKALPIASPFNRGRIIPEEMISFYLHQSINLLFSLLWSAACRFQPQHLSTEIFTVLSLCISKVSLSGLDLKQ